MLRELDDGASGQTRQAHPEHEKHGLVTRDNWGVVRITDKGRRVRAAAAAEGAGSLDLFAE